MSAMETLADGYGLLEAPCVDAEGGVWFSDVMGGGVHRWTAAGGVETLLPKRRGIGGMALHRHGGAVVSGRDLTHFRDGESRVLLEAPDGVSGFNDIAAAPDGSLYAGALRWHPFKGEQPVPGEVWRVGPDGSASVVFEGVEWANGMGFSPDGETLYVCDYGKGQVLAWSGGEPSLFASSPSGGADGLAVDEEGGVWVALGQGGALARFDESGSLTDEVQTGMDFASSLCFAGTDIYVTTIGALLHGEVGVAGLPVPLAAV